MSYVGPQAATLSSVAGTVTSVSLFAQQAGVFGRVVYNDSSAVLYLAYGTAATTASYTVQVPSQGYFEFPAPVYGGPVSGVWSATAGSARTTAW